MHSGTNGPGGTHAAQMIIFFLICSRSSFALFFRTFAACSSAAALMAAVTLGFVFMRIPCVCPQGGTVRD